MLEAENEETPWQRVLWLKQSGYPDNYLDESFLENLQRNVNVREYTYRGLLHDTLPVTQHLCSTLVFVAVFTHIYDGSIGHSTLSAFTAISSIAGYALWEYLAKPEHTRTAAVSSALTLSAILLLLSPILQTLSKATTSDSIWPLSACLFFLNAILAEYGGGQDNQHQLHFPSSLSLNAAVCASAVLSSRLASQLDVFALMLFSIEWFALLPLLRKAIQRSASANVNIATTVTLAGLGLLLFLPISLSMSGLYVVGVGGLQFAMPFWLLQLQSLKNEIRGPWDAAVPKI